MNRLLIILFGIGSTMAVLVLLFLLYRFATAKTVSPTVDRNHGTVFQDSKKKVTDTTVGWLEDLATQKKPSFSYPVSEMEIDLPLAKRSVPSHLFRLHLKDLDGYKVFCIRQILEQQGIRYAMFRENRNGVLVIHDLSPKEVDRIIGLVREYDVGIEIEKYKKE